MMLREFQSGKLQPLGLSVAILFVISIIIFSSCETRNDEIEFAELVNQKIYRDTDSSIYISKDFIINDRVIVRDSIFNYNTYEEFLSRLVKSGKFLFVTQNEFDTTFSDSKVIISLRHDIDYDIQSAIRFARREHKYGIRATYFFLNTADYYSDVKKSPEIRKPLVLDYMRKIQNEYSHEIGWHNDLVTMEIVYNSNVYNYLTTELGYLRNQGIKISGTSYHGSEFCYKYHYLNFYVWKGLPQYGPKGHPFENYDSVLVNSTYKKISKFNLDDFGFRYEAGILKLNGFYTDVTFHNDKRWNMKMVNWEALKPGSKIVVLTHPALWD